MYFNNYIQIALYFPLIFVFIDLLGFTPKSPFSKKFKALYGILIFITFIGILKGAIYGMYLNKNTQYINEDLLKLFAFVFFIGFPFYIIALKEKWIIFLNKYFNFFAFIYTVLVSLSLFIIGNFDETNYSIYPGNLFGASTVNLTIISAWSFYSLAQYAITKKKLFLIWTLLCYLDIVISLAKWNFIAIITYPIIISLILNAGKSFNNLQKKIFITLIIIGCLMIFNNADKILKPVLEAGGWESFDDYLKNRVLGESDNTENLGQSISFRSDLGLKDGARSIMWADLIFRTLENSIMGIGLGSRALENEGLFVEDHNIFVTHFSRYGIPLFIFWLWYVILVIKWLLSYIKTNSSLKVLEYIFVIIYINFFFQASVGNIWGQNLVVLFIGTSIGLLVYNSKQLSK